MDRAARPVLEAIAALWTVEKPTWGGTATELVAALPD